MSQRCRLASRRHCRALHPLPRVAAASLTTKASIHDMLSSPTWSIRTLRGPSTNLPAEPITPPQLHHLLRLAALPLPAFQDEEDAMIATLQSQLQFVRAVQRVKTEGVEPLSAIRDETDQGVEENTIGLEHLRHELAEETLVGYYKRPRRVREKVRSEAEKWDALSMASRKAGKYFVVESGPKDGGTL